MDAEHCGCALLAAPYDKEESSKNQSHKHESRNYVNPISQVPFVVQCGVQLLRVVHNLAYVVAKHCID